MLILGFVNIILGDKEKKVTTFDDVRFKGLIFSILIDKLIGTDLGEKIKTITRESRIEDINHNCQLVSATITEFGLNFHANPQDLAVASPVEMLLYMFNLLTALPMYFPKQTIKFTCELREEAHKLI